MIGANLKEDDIISQMGWRAAMAKVLATRGALDDAERLARQAVELGEGTTYTSIRGNLWFRLGEVLRSVGRIDEAVDAVRHALELWERKQNVVMAERARRALADMSASPTG